MIYLPAINSYEKINKFNQFCLSDKINFQEMASSLKIYMSEFKISTCF